MTDTTTRPPRESEALLELRGAAFSYDGEVILRDVDLAIREGDFLGILGANGSGKTTLLRGLLGLLPTHAGALQRARKLRVGYVPQRERLDPIFPLSVAEVIQMGLYGQLRAGTWLPRGSSAVVRRALEEVDLGERLRAPFDELSGGQRQRVLIARALAGEPDLLILDEPTSGVDERSEKAILTLLHRRHAEQGLTVLLVSHALHLVQRTVREVIWVREGGISRQPVSSMKSAATLGELLG